MEIKKYLKKLGIKFKTFRHPPVYTCEQAEKHTKNIKGIHSKNLFVKNRQSRQFYLVILPSDKKLDTNKLGKILNDKIKFANEDDLKKLLSLTTGSVSPFGLINDKEHKVKIIIDKKIWESNFVSFHPNINTETLELSGRDFQKYIKSLDNEIKIKCPS